jgi:hypothetical protein
MTRGDGSREEVDLGATGPRADTEPAAESLPQPLSPMGSPPDHDATADAVEPTPGTSPLDDLTSLLDEEAP